MTITACIFNIQKFSLHDGPGIRTVIFFKGCPLKCKWCSNPEAQNPLMEPMWDNHQRKFITIGEHKSVDQLLKEILQDLAFYEESGGGVTLSGGEVLLQSDFALELINKLKKNNIHIACETTGFAPKEVFSEFIKDIDLLLFDLKHYCPIQHQKSTGVTNELILTNLKFALENHANILVRIPIIPKFNNSLKDATNFAQLLNDLGVRKVELLPFHSFGAQKYEFLNREYELSNLPQLYKEDLQEFKAILELNNINCIVN